MAGSTRLVDLVQQRIDDFVAERTPRSRRDLARPRRRSTRRAAASSPAANASAPCSATGAGRRSRGRARRFDPMPGPPSRRARFPAVVAVAAALELFHAAALVHDDIMDNSDLRRGRTRGPQALRGAARASGAGPATARDFGASAALLLGDLLLGWSDELFDDGSSPLPDRDAGERRPQRVRPDAHRGHRRAVPRHPRGARLAIAAGRASCSRARTASSSTSRRSTASSRRS